MVEKKKFDPNPTGAKLFWRIQRELWSNMLTPYIMYLFMGLVMLAIQGITAEKSTALEISLSLVCLAFAAALNGHLMYNCGKNHYDAFVTGELHRRNRANGIESGGDHRVEREYAPWKGFAIGLCVGAPVLVFGTLAGIWYDVFALPCLLLAAWAFMPLTWFGYRPEEMGGGLLASPFYTLLFILLPVIVSGAMYLIGAHVERKRKEAQAERAARVAELAEEARKRREEEQLRRSEEQRQRAKGKKK